MRVLASLGVIAIIAVVVVAIIAGDKGSITDPGNALHGGTSDETSHDDDSDDSHGDDSDGSHGEAAGSSSEQHVETNLVRRNSNDIASLGSVDAPIVLIEYSDFRCPFCAVVSNKIFPELIETYVDTGKMRIEWRDMPLKGDESVLAAKAARAAGLQEKFWAFNETVYRNSPENGVLSINEALLIEFAKEAGVTDLEKFVEDMNSTQFDDVIYRDLMEARSINANGTPTFIIGNQMVPGAQPIEVFHQIIQGELQKAENGVIKAP